MGVLFFSRSIFSTSVLIMRQVRNMPSQWPVKFQDPAVADNEATDRPTAVVEAAETYAEAEERIAMQLGTDESLATEAEEDVVNCSRDGGRGQPRRVPWSTAVAEKGTLIFDTPGIRDSVVSWCPPSPGRQFNQIAIADRLLNISWRRRGHVLHCDLLGSAICLFQTVELVRPGNCGMVLLRHLENIFNTERAAQIAAAERQITASRTLQIIPAEREAHSQHEEAQERPLGALRFANYVPRRCRFAPHCARCMPYTPDTDSDHGASD